MGCSTCSRRVAARPSQKKESFQARLSSGGALRVPMAPSDAAAEAAVFGEGLAGVMAGGARLAVVLGKPGVKKQFAAEHDALAGERVVARQVGLREKLRDGKVIRRGIRRDDQMLRGAGEFRDGRIIPHAADGEGGFDVLAEPAGEDVVGARVRGIAGGAQFDGVRRGEDFAGVEDEFEFAVGGKRECGGQFDGHQATVGGEVKRIAAGPAIVAPAAFEREKDVAAGPAPMQAVDLGIERMSRRGIARRRCDWRRVRGPR